MKDQEKQKINAFLPERRQLLMGLGTLLALAILLAVGLRPTSAKAPVQEPDTAQAGSQLNNVLSGDCQVIQHLIYTRCGHDLTRRQTLPMELAGKGRAEAEAAYDLWQITGFSAKELTMEQRTELFCPQHQVLMPDASGMLCIFENRYGDALALVRSLDVPVSSLPEATQEELRSGKGFDSVEALEQWLENAES